MTVLQACRLNSEVATGFATSKDRFATGRASAEPRYDTRALAGLFQIKPKTPFYRAAIIPQFEQPMSYRAGGSERGGTPS